jgi:hypothetical protein
MGKGSGWFDFLFQGNRYGLSLEGPDDDRQRSLSVFFTQYKRIRSTLGLTVGDAFYIQTY